MAISFGARLALWRVAGKRLDLCLVGVYPALMYTVAALYHFTRFPDPDALRPGLKALCAAEGVMGSLLLATEGINGTIAGPRAGIDAVLAHIRALPGCADLVWKESSSETPPFPRMKVKLKAEIVTLGVPDVDPLARVGRHIAPKDWNALITDPDVVVIDTRNDYEVEVGTFQGAIDPKTVKFRDFPGWWEAHAAEFSGKKVAMFCTGGIRCEKSTNYLLGQGVQEVFHLQGGILKYLEEIPEEQSLWQGECFVFDHRIAVGHGLKQGRTGMCMACGRPVPEGASHACPKQSQNGI
jgi:UPF0176 protein